MAGLDQAPDPHGVIAWVVAIADTVKAATAAILIPLAGVVAWIVKLRTDAHRERRKWEDDKQTAEDAKRQKIEDGLDEERAEAFSRLRADLADARKAIAEKDHELNRLLSLTRRWYDIAHNTWHSWSQVLTLVILQNRLDRPLNLPPHPGYDIDKPE